MHFIIILLILCSNLVEPFFFRVPREKNISLKSPINDDTRETFTDVPSLKGINNEKNQTILQNTPQDLLEKNKLILPNNDTQNTFNLLKENIVEKIEPPNINTNLDVPTTENKVIDSTIIVNVELKNKTNNITYDKNQKSMKHIMESGAIYRSFYVLLGLSGLAVAYFIYRGYRSNQAPSNIVSKYGVKTRRNDMEMAPLPISDEEEDTLYEKTQRSNQSAQYYDYNNITTYEIK